MEAWPLYFFVAGTITHKNTESKMAIHEEFFPEHPQARSHHITVRAHIPWVIPEIAGSLPPRKEDNPFLHALILLLLFVPWREIPELLSSCKTEEDVVMRYHEQRRSWETIVEGLGVRRPADVPSKEAFPSPPRPHSFVPTRRCQSRPSLDCFHGVQGRYDPRHAHG